MKGNVLSILLLFITALIFSMDENRPKLIFPPIVNRGDKFTVRMPPDQTHVPFEQESSLGDAIADAAQQTCLLSGMLQTVQGRVFKFPKNKEMPLSPMMLYRMKKSDTNMNKAHASLLQIIGRLDYLQDCRDEFIPDVLQIEQDGQLMIEMSSGYLQALRHVNFCLWSMCLCMQSIQERKKQRAYVSQGKLRKMYQEFLATKPAIDEMCRNYYSFLKNLKHLNSGEN